MPGSTLIPPLDSEAPTKPERSLPSYSEPSPETRRQMSREEEAELALNNTRFSPGARSLLIALFLLTIAAVPAIQLAAELRASPSFKDLPMFDVFGLLPSREKLHAVHSFAGLWNLPPRATEIKAREKALEDRSVVSQWLLPQVQAVLSGAFQLGNEQAITGRDGWLFYRPDVETVTGPPFLNPARMKERARIAGMQPDPVQAIVEFRDQLAKRGIELIVMPVPAKPTIESGMVSAKAAGAGMLQNPSFEEFKARLKRGGVRMFDPTPLLLERKKAGSQYLETDTHWRPETMEFVAQRLATFVSSNAPPGTGKYQVVEKEITSLGDIASMLKLPAGQTIYKKQAVSIHQVISGNALWRQSRDADVLLMGDSFCNIFSLPEMGWGESAGFAEHLSRALGRPLDCILRNSDAAFATREILSKELALGRDRLAGKKQVVWEFASRELAFGNWKPLAMTLGAPRASCFFTPRTGERIEVTGLVEAISPVPRSGSVPYKDHILTVHLVDLTGALPPAGNASLQSLVYLWSMRDNVWTKAARLRPGDRITVRLQPWADVSGQYEKINRSELDEQGVDLEEPVWGNYDSGH